MTFRPPSRVANPVQMHRCSRSACVRRVRLMIASEAPSACHSRAERETEYAARSDDRKRDRPPAMLKSGLAQIDRPRRRRCQCSTAPLDRRFWSRSEADVDQRDGEVDDREDTCEQTRSLFRTGASALATRATDAAPPRRVCPARRRQYASAEPSAARRAVLTSSRPYAPGSHALTCEMRTPAAMHHVVAFAVRTSTNRAVRRIRAASRGECCMFRPASACTSANVPLTFSSPRPR